MIIDTHQHFWRLARGDYGWLTAALAPIFRDFTPDDLLPILKAAGVSRTIAVQAAPTVAETEFLLSLADRHDWIAGVVGWVDLVSSDAPRQIAALAGHPRLVGLRPMIQDIPDDDWILDPALGPAIASMIEHDLTFDALVLPRHLSRLQTFLSRHPGLRVVIDHCAKPGIHAGRMQPWADDMAAVAAHPNTVCKLSGLTTEAGPGWSAEALAPYLEHVLGCFGQDRVLFGSDWPVMELATCYQDWVEIVAAHVPLDTMTRAALQSYPRARILD